MRDALLRRILSRWDRCEKLLQTYIVRKMSVRTALSQFEESGLNIYTAGCEIICLGSLMARVGHS